MNYVIIYRDELKSDVVFEQYKNMQNAIYNPDEEYVKFLTCNLPKGYLHGV